MRNIITSVDPCSPAERAGVRPGERLAEISGHPIQDVLDYRFFGYDKNPVLTLESEQGSRKLRVKKGEGEDLGLNFETYLMDKARSCANRCIFCFVDQMPPGMRETLYFKDDDARLSFLMGNYLTLTNLSQREIQRICDLRISPINVSVHTTDPELRCRMLQNRRAGESIEVMRRFAKAHITMNCQIVACPGLNDGPALDRTLRELGALHPAVESVAVVPVGVTRYREGLPEIHPYTGEQAAALIDQVEAFAKEFLEQHGTSLAWCSDEFYLLAGRELPEKGYYEDMDQLENGVGMLRLLLSQAELAAEDEFSHLTPSPFAVATGVSAAPFIRQAAALVQQNCPALKGTVYPIVNDFFGHTITVSGLRLLRPHHHRLRPRHREGPDGPAPGQGPGAAAADSLQHAPQRGAGISGRRHRRRGVQGPGCAGDRGGGGGWLRFGGRYAGFGGASAGARGSPPGGRGILPLQPLGERVRKREERIRKGESYTMSKPVIAIVGRSHRMCHPAGAL